MVCEGPCLWLRCHSWTSWWFADKMRPRLVCSVTLSGKIIPWPVPPYCYYFDVFLLTWLHLSSILLLFTVHIQSGEQIKYNGSAILMGKNERAWLKGDRDSVSSTYCQVSVNGAGFVCFHTCTCRKADAGK